jgi:hypothetical protein
VSRHIQIPKQSIGSLLNLEIEMHKQTGIVLTLGRQEVLLTKSSRIPQSSDARPRLIA